jgi:hypothetical protein
MLVLAVISSSWGLACSSSKDDPAATGGRSSNNNSGNGSDDGGADEPNGNGGTSGGQADASSGGVANDEPDGGSDGGESNGGAANGGSANGGSSNDGGGNGGSLDDPDPALSEVSDTPVEYCALARPDATAEGTLTVFIDGTQVGPYYVDMFGGEPTTTAIVACSPLDMFPGTNIRIEHYAHLREDPPVGMRVIGTDGDFAIFLTDSREAADVMHVSESGEAEVTVFEFADKHFAGTASVVTDQGSTIDVEWDVTITN